MTVGSLGYAAENLNGTAGKVFRVNQPDKNFQFLKQDVKYDPETGEGKAWYTVHWTNETTFRYYEERRNLSKVKGPIVAEFKEIDDENAAALEKGQSFRADRMVLRPDLKRTTGVSADGRSVVGWFTPREAKYSRDGVLKLDGKEIPAGVKRGRIRITIQKDLSSADMADGFWKATLEGKQDNGSFVAEDIRLEPLVNPFAVDDPELPRVLSVGDSICMNYEKAARQELKGIANYHRIEDNCWSTERGVAFMAYWLGDYTREGLGWEVILFNSGMHDMKQKQLGGAYAVPLDVYKDNLRKEIEIMKKTGATLVFCTTTPVPNDLGSAQYAFRSKGAEKDFNLAAREVLRDYPDIQIADLCKVVNESSVYDQWRQGKDVHFWDVKQQAVLGKAVAAAVVKALKSRQDR